MGLLATTVAIVLGMLVASAKSFYDTQSPEVTQMAANFLLLGRVLVHYGQEPLALATPCVPFFHVSQGYSVREIDLSIQHDAHKKVAQNSFKTATVPAKFLSQET